MNDAMTTRGRKKWFRRYVDGGWQVTIGRYYLGRFDRGWGQHECSAPEYLCPTCGEGGYEDD